MLHEVYRREVLNYSRLLSRHGFFGTQSGAGGNVSCKIKEESVVAITPSGKNYHRIETEDVCLTDLDGNVIEGAHQPSVEAGMHLTVYKNRPEIGAVMHTHPDFASALSIIACKIPLLFDEAVHGLLQPVELVPYELSGSYELEQQVASRLQNGGACYLLQNHGALSLGANLEQAFYRAELLEKCARVYYYALCTGREITRLERREDESEC